MKIFIKFLLVRFFNLFFLKQNYARMEKMADKNY